MLSARLRGSAAGVGPSVMGWTRGRRIGVVQAHWCRDALQMFDRMRGRDNVWVCVSELFRPPAERSKLYPDNSAANQEEKMRLSMSLHNKPLVQDFSYIVVVAEAKLDIFVQEVYGRAPP